MQESVCKAYPSFLKAGLKKENLLFSVSCRQGSKLGTCLIKEYSDCSCCGVLMENIKLCLWCIHPWGCGCTVEWRWLSKKGRIWAQQRTSWKYEVINGIFHGNIKHFSKTWVVFEGFRIDSIHTENTLKGEVLYVLFFITLDDKTLANCIYSTPQFWHGLRSFYSLPLPLLVCG